MHYNDGIKEIMKMTTKSTRNLNHTDDGYDDAAIAEGIAMMENLRPGSIVDAISKGDEAAFGIGWNVPTTTPRMKKAAKDHKRIETKGFIKHDGGKVDLTLLPFESLEAIAKVMMFGAEKYERDNWKKCEDSNRYMQAMLRHLSEIQKGNDIDEETGLSHMSHVGCNVLFLLYLMERSEYLEATTDGNKD